MSAYITLDELKDLAQCVDADSVDAFETNNAGVIAKMIQSVSALVDTRLTKRYAFPIVPDSECPQTVKQCVADIVCLRLYRKRGYNPGSEQDDDIKEAAQEAEKYIIEASNSETGFIELPRRASEPGSSGISKGGPWYSGEASPYGWMDTQYEEIQRRGGR